MNTIKRTKRKKSQRTYKKTYHRSRKASKASQSSLVKILKFVLVLGGLLLFVYYFFLQSLFENNHTTDINQNTSSTEGKQDVEYSGAELLDIEINGLFTEFKLQESWIQKTHNIFIVQIPKDVSSIILIHKIAKIIDKLGYNLLSSTEDLITNKSIVEIGKDDKLIRKIIFNHNTNLARNRGKIAIIIDDFGYSVRSDIKRLLSSPYQITCAIIPGLPKSNELYDQIQQAQKEILIHLPMEAMEQAVEYSHYTIYTKMSQEEISKRIQRAINDFPNCKGINNHMGSKATSDEATMENVLSEIKKHNIFFIDSKTTNQSVVDKVAQKLNIAYASRDIFLERERNDSIEYLRNKIKAAAKIAETSNSAIAIGHPYPNTIAVLMEEIPKLQKLGYSIVPVSELINDKSAIKNDETEN